MTIAEWVACKPEGKSLSRAASVSPTAEGLIIRGVDSYNRMNLTLVEAYNLRLWLNENLGEVK